MAISKLSLYNDALVLLGERKLVSTDDAIPSRYELDTAYDDPAAIDYCLELVKPKFALLTAKLISPTTPTNHSLAYEYAFPSDYIDIYKLYSDAELDERIHRFIIEGRTVACDNPTNVWLRYVTNSIAMTTFTPTFSNVVSAYLAKQIAPRIAPQKLMDIEELFLSRVNAAIQLEGVKEEEERPRAATVTLDADWRKMYNRAFFILGLNEITSNDDDSLRRSKADVVVGTGLVESVLEDTGWMFGNVSQKLDYDPNLEPGWGYNRVFNKPLDMHRLNGMFQDEWLRIPLRWYHDEGDRWYCGNDEIYVEYVTTSFLTNASAWPAYFVNMLAAELAVRLAPGLAPDKLDYALNERDKIEREAQSADAMSGPPQIIKDGNWVTTRFTNRRGGGYNGRP